jgi:hypothetical protein
VLPALRVTTNTTELLETGAWLSLYFSLSVSHQLNIFQTVYTINMCLVSLQSDSEALFSPFLLLFVLNLQK